jgi:ABC-2 type transport system permease protein
MQITSSPFHAIRINISVLLANTRVRLITVSRYPGQLLTEIFIPIVFAAMPILLGRATGGADIAGAFEANTGTRNYAGYMLIGSSVFSIVSLAFWHVAYWLRFEQETGTLEAIYLTPVNRIWVVAGTALYSFLRSLFSATAAYLVGSVLLGVNPFQGEIALAYLFIFFGALPLYGMTLLFGAVVLKVKEANAVISLMQWGITFLMGVFFPISVFPPLLKVLALLFPPTWMTNGVRSALLGVGYFFGEWYLDLAILWAFMLFAPLFGYWVFRRVETGIRRNEGVGTF